MTSLLKIIMISPRYFPAIGGVERHVQSIAELLASKGHSITVISASHESGLPSCEVISGVKIQRMPFAVIKNPFLAMLWMIRHRSEILSNDIIHVHDTIPFLLWYFPLRILYPTRKVHITFHGFERDPVPLIFRLTRKIAHLLTKSKLCIGGFIESIYGVKCSSISIGAVSSIPYKNEDRNGIAYVGRIERDTGIQEYLELASILKGRYDIESKFNIAGEGSLLEDFRKQIERQHLNVTFTGAIQEPQSFLRNAQVSLAAGYLSILESLSVGTPVIALAKSSLKMSYYKSIRDIGAPISIQTTLDGCARKIAIILSNEELRTRIASKGMEFASRMSWGNLLSTYFRLWNL